MAQLAKISEQVQLKASADKFYDFLTTKMDSFVHMFPENVKSYKFVEGNDFSHGSVVHWKYDFGSPAEAKVKLAIDAHSKSVTFECLEGDILGQFEVFRVKVQVNDGGSNGVSSVTWSAEFVKANEDVPPPDNYLEFGVKMCRGIDAYLSKS